MALDSNTIELKIGGVPEHFNLPWRITIESGVLQKHSIKASWHDFHGGTGAMVKALNAGEVDVATLLTEGAVKALADKDCQFELFSFYTKTPLIWGVHTPANSAIKSLSDIKNATFVISRYGSGSHLMAYLLAESLGFDSDDLKFEIAHNLDGARELFRSGANHVFLWEKFMTKPYVDNGEMRLIDDFPTPWSCFVTCVNKSVLNKHPKQIKQLMKQVLKTARQLKQSPITPKLIASHYQLQLKDVKTWLAATQWQKHKKLDMKLIKKVEAKLRQLNVI
ncbi:PhnD/SsuA/transferrin family substrate-binding protein [Kangiella sp. TOML190]|uniref:PhnD/SsuA/transferrin family substrate-binding protein n=1 Tax=Kangiella sp. TOML190 TaxID=2931351 RepID=UPI0020419B40|nr:PhnD/SsuA/transferrin family substrate-binding protein [Kangiella sp. TOML190]